MESLQEEEYNNSVCILKKCSEKVVHRKSWGPNKKVIRIANEKRPRASTAKLFLITCVRAYLQTICSHQTFNAEKNGSVLFLRPART